MFKDNYQNKIQSQYSELKTPCYIINAEQLENNIREMKDAFVKCWGNRIRIGYSVKTNHNRTMLEIAKKSGASVEVVSSDEFQWALACGYEPQNIVVNGPQKTVDFLISALEKGSLVNLDNLDEVAVVETWSERLKRQEIHVGIRVNFALERDCPGETKTGELASRFGICLENGDFEQAVKRLKQAGITVEGLHFHYSTKSRSAEVFQTIAKKAAYVIRKYELQEIRYIDFGGGYFGGRVLTGKPTMDDYARAITEQLKEVVDCANVELVLEPGSSIIATAVDYLTKVIHTRNIGQQKVITLDGSNLDINPFLYERVPDHTILGKQMVTVCETQLVGGATCMEQDRFMILHNEKELSYENYILFHHTGAYTMCFNNGFINLPVRIYLCDKEQLTMVRENCGTGMLNLV